MALMLYEYGTTLMNSNELDHRVCFQEPRTCPTGWWRRGSLLITARSPAPLLPIHAERGSAQVEALLICRAVF